MFDPGLRFVRPLHNPPPTCGMQTSDWSAELLPRYHLLRGIWLSTPRVTPESVHGSVYGNRGLSDMIRITMTFIEVK